MTASARSLLGAALLLLLGAASAALSPSKGAAVQDVFRRMLNLRPPGNLSTSAVSAPRHMLELYQRYSSKGGAPLSGRGSTVRSILPLQAEADLLVFNVSCVEAGEDLAAAQLHLRRRRLASRPRVSQRRRLAPPHRVRLYRVVKGVARPLASLAVPGAGPRGWRPLDVTAALRELLLLPPPALLGIRFQEPGGRSLPPGQFLKVGGGPSPAYLVLFSEDTVENDVQGPSAAVGDLLVHTDIGATPRLRHQQFTPADQHPDDAVGDYEEEDNSLLRTARRRRRLRSIADNELPEIPTRSLPRTSPGSLLNGRPAPGDNSVSAPPPSRRWRGTRRRQGAPRRRQHHRRFYQQEESLHENSAAVDVAVADDTCRRRRLVVDFADIGWSGWIIEPSSFQAHYCAGQCPFPLSKALKPTNHATIQSLVHAIGSQPGVPAPCCVPDTLSSMSLLYMDDMGNVVLKSYPSMTVDSCACR